MHACRENASAFAFPAGAFYKIAYFKIKSAFESIFVGQLVHCFQLELLEAVLRLLPGYRRAKIAHPLNHHKAQILQVSQDFLEMLAADKLFCLLFLPGVAFRCRGFKKR